MNRVIKFRAKTLNYDPMAMPEWAVGCYYQELHQDRMRHLITDGAHTFEVDEKTLGQFTGLKDKNGKEIYEGDILEWPDGLRKWIGIVVWEDCGFLIEHYRPRGTKAKYKMEEFDDEVIGNIHDNPELLKGGENA